ncbi:hypothetical protein L6164_010371 [Bauhinia variegata]|uniref:Uncharacterized protein n=1 Tax=Bauhinia variegata TaxID=167791 RepID=A0ACB9PT97_BAUVA|nr:hypothetical protein L6164_010371 [Bauhinia variegata]
MAEKMPDSTRPRVTSSSYHPTSMNGNEFAELVWQNGQILVQRGGTSSNRQKGSSCIGYSESPSHDIGYEEDVCITKRARLNTYCSLFPASHKNFDMGSTHRESQQSNVHQCYQFDLPYAKSKNSFKNFDTHLMVEDECPDFRRAKESKFNGGAYQLTSFGNSEFCSSSSQQCPASASFMTPRIPTPSSQKQDLRTVEKVNFPNFVRPTEFFKSTNQSNRATQQTSSVVLAGVKEIKTSKDDNNSVAVTTSKAPEHSISSNKGSHSLKQKPTATNANQVPSVANSSREPLPHERSKAMRNNSAFRIHGCQDSSLAVNGAKGKTDTYQQLVPSSSVCSLGASNDPTYLSTKHEVEDTYYSAYSSENDEEEEGLTEEERPPEGARGKRSRTAEIRNLSERKRRDKFNKKMRALKELIPNCNKMDKASMLDDAIEHLKTLKLQLQIMSLGTGMCMPFMMLPAGANHLNPLHLTQFPQLGTGIGLRPSTVTPCNLPAQFPPPQLGPASLPGITDNGLPIPAGFPSQILPISIPHAPFFPMLGKPFTQPVLPTSTPSNLAHHLASSPLPTLNDSIPNKAELNAQPECPYVQYK